MKTKIAALLVIGGLGFSSVALAAGNEEKSATSAVAAENLGTPVPVMAAYQPAMKRPGLLPALYVTLGTMQAWDAYTTSTALKAGAREGNPVAAPFATNARSMMVLKATTTASTIFFAERMWKKNPTAAVVLLTAINGATAAVALHNQHNARVAAGR